MYEIIVKKNVETQVGETQVWQKISDTGGEGGGSKYGYVAKPPHTKTETKTVFTQHVDELNILKFVAAVNGQDW
jgi:hypothetical protein